MKIEEILANYEKLKELVNSDKHLPIQLNYAIAKNIQIIESELEVFNKSRMALIDRYAMKDPSGNLLVKGSNYVFETTDLEEQFGNEMKELAELELDVQVKRVPFEVMEYNTERFDVLTTKEVIALDFMIE